MTPAPFDITEDRLLDGRVCLRQPASGHRAGIDPVFLAAAIPVEPGERILDAGAGTGAAALCLAVRAPNAFVTGLEIDPILVRLANANAAATGVADRVQVFAGDLRAPPLRMAPGSFHHVMANPPYVAEGTGRRPVDASKATATVEGEAKLDAWVRFAALMTAGRGTLTMIHRADRLGAVLAALEGRFGDATIFPLWPGGVGGKPAKRVIVQARKGSSAPLKLVQGLVLHQPDGAFTEAADAVLRRGASIVIGGARSDPG